MPTLALPSPFHGGPGVIEGASVNTGDTINLRRRTYEDSDQPV